MSTHEQPGRAKPRKVVRHCLPYFRSNTAAGDVNMAHPGRPPPVPELDLARAAEGAGDGGVVGGDGRDGADGALLAHGDGRHGGIAARPAAPHTLELVVVPEAPDEALRRGGHVHRTSALREKGSYPKSD